MAEPTPEELLQSLIELQQREQNRVRAVQGAVEQPWWQPSMGGAMAGLQGLATKRDPTELLQEEQQAVQEQAAAQEQARLQWAMQQAKGYATMQQPQGPTARPLPATEPLPVAEVIAGTPEVRPVAEVIGGPPEILSAGVSARPQSAGAILDRIEQIIDQEPVAAEPGRLPGALSPEEDWLRQDEELMP